MGLMILINKLNGGIALQQMFLDCIAVGYFGPAHQGLLFTNPQIQIWYI